MWIGILIGLLIPPAILVGVVGASMAYCVYQDKKDVKKSPAPATPRFKALEPAVVEPDLEDPALEPEFVKIWDESFA